MIVSRLVQAALALQLCLQVCLCQDIVSNSSPIIDQGLVRSSPLYGIISEHLQNATVRLEVVPQCRQDSELMMNGINNREMWALKALDASGAVRNSFVWGQKAWLGSEPQCSYLNGAPSFTLTPTLHKKMDDRLIDTTAPTPMLYRMVFTNFTSRYQVDSLLNMHFVNRLGLCMPASCTDADITIMAQSFWQHRRLSFQQLYDVEAAVVLVRSMNMHNFGQLSQVHWIMGAIVLTAIVVVLLGSLSSKSAFVQCFSLRHNMAKLFAPASARAGAIGVISGVRSIICMWVMLFHVVFYSMFTYDNLPELFQSLDGFAVQGVLAIVLYVDVFFVLSGCLLAYNFVGNADQLRRIRTGTGYEVCGTYVRQVLHRYLRLTPALFLALGLSHCVALYLQQSSAHYVEEQFDLYCTRTGWWHALFYVQNLYATVDMCTTWSWYVACDMQFYAVMLLLLYVYAKWPEAAVWIFSALLALVLAVSFGVLLHFEITPKIDVLLANLDAFYTPPWMRILPYMAGIVGGVLIERLKRNKFTATPGRIRAYWILVGGVCIGSLFALYLKTIPVWSFAAAFSVGRLVMSLCWASAIGACAIGMGGTVARMLGSQLFVHMDRLTYMMFVLNPVLVGAVNAGQQNAVDHFDVVPTITKVIGIWVLSYGAALAMSPIFEMPFQRLSETYLLGRKS